eukprot:PITA_06638
MAEAAVSRRSMWSDLCYLQTEDVKRSFSPAPTVISVLSSLVERILARNERLTATYTPTSPAKYRVFDGLQVPDMCIERYLERILKYVNCSSSVLVVAYAYIDRLIQFHPQFRITSVNVHRLLITTVMVASKFLEDLNYRNSYYARVGGVSSEEINRMEMDFLFLMGFKLQVSVNVFESYCSHLEREVMLGGGFQIERTLRPFVFCGIAKTSSATGFQKRETCSLLRRSQVLEYKHTRNAHRSR